MSGNVEFKSSGSGNIMMDKRGIMNSMYECLLVEDTSDDVAYQECMGFQISVVLIRRSIWRDEANELRTSG